MSDLLLDIGQNRRARKLIQTIGLPIPLPQKLARARGPYRERPLSDRRVAVALGPRAELATVLAQGLAEAGADVQVAGDVSAFRDAGEAFGRPARAVNGTVEEVGAIVLDATGLSSSADLAELHGVFQRFLEKLGRSGRAVCLVRPHRASVDLGRAVAQRAVEGFVRSLAKEIGRRGATANVVIVEPGAEARLPAVLRFLLSERSAFVSGQPLAVTSLAASGPADTLARPLEGKVALVTGAARGIGKATASRLAEEGAEVVCLDRPADDGPLSQVARDVGGRVILCDVSSPGAPDAIAAALPKGVDIVVHNAGVTRDKTLARMKPEAWSQALDINLGAVVAITERLLAGVIHDHGRIVVLSSVAGIAGNMGQTNYAAGKAGLIGLCDYLAPRLAPRGITVNAVAPGFIETRLTAAIPAVIREVGRRLSALGQGGLPEDVAEAITFLCTPGAQGLSGAVLRVCGGAFIGA